MPENYGQGYGNGYPQQPAQGMPQQPMQGVPQQPMQGPPQQPMGGQPPYAYGGYPQGGQPMPMNGQYGYPNGQMPKKGLGAGAIIGIVVGVVALLGLILLLTRPASDDGKTPNDGSDTPTTTTTTTTGNDDNEDPWTSGTGTNTTGTGTNTTGTGTSDDETQIDIYGGVGGDEDVRATGTGQGGSGWTTYNNPEAAAADIGYTLEIPATAYGRNATDFLVRTDSDGAKYLWYEYWDAGVGNFKEFGVVAKMKDNIPPTLGTSENEHRVPNGDSFIIVCGNDSETLAVWMAYDAAGDFYGYSVHFNQKMTDEEMLEFVNQVK